MKHKNPYKRVKQLLESFEIANGPIEIREITNGPIEIGQVRSISVQLDDGSLQRYVAVASMPEQAFVQIILIGDDEQGAGYNDIILEQNERPMPLSSVLQTDWTFGVLIEDLGPVYSTLSQETLNLVSKMNNWSGRDLSRVGFHPNDQDPTRVEIIEENFQVSHWALGRVLSHLENLEN
jgi:hypothetical protein